MGIISRVRSNPTLSKIRKWQQKKRYSSAKGKTTDISKIYEKQIYESEMKKGKQKDIEKKARERAQRHLKYGKGPAAGFKEMLDNGEKKGKKKKGGLFSGLASGFGNMAKNASDSSFGGGGYSTGFDPIWGTSTSKPRKKRRKRKKKQKVIILDV